MREGERERRREEVRNKLRVKRGREERKKRG